MLLGYACVQDADRRGLGASRLDALGEPFGEVRAEGTVNSVEALSEGRPTYLGRTDVRGQQDRQLRAGRRGMCDKAFAHTDRPARSCATAARRPRLAE